MIKFGAQIFTKRSILLIKVNPDFKRTLSLSMEMKRNDKMLKTLNLTDSTWTVPYPHIGSIGHVVDFPRACRLAAEHGYDAVNLDVDYCLKEGPQAVKNVMREAGVQPGAFRFPVRITDEADVIADGEFERGLEQFKKEAGVCA